MLYPCQDSVTEYPDFSGDSRPKLLFVCRTQGEESAIPRVMHKHDDRLEIMFIAKGSGQYLIGGRQYLAQEGDILIFNQDVVHDERPHVSSDSLIYSCGISGLNLEGLPVNHLISRDQSAVIATGQNAQNIFGVFEAMCSQVFRDEHHYGVVTWHLLNALIVMCRNSCLLRHEELKKTEKSLGLSIKEFLDENYKEAMNLEDMTSQLGITRFYLIHVFKRYSGFTPKQYIIRRRVGEAQSLLLSTELDIAAIATQVGYESVNNFHRVFKMVVGIPPTQYKNLWMEGSQSLTG